MLMLLSVFLSACSAEGDPLWMDAAAWGRARYIRSISEGKAFDFVAGPEDAVYFVIPVAYNGTYQADIFKLDDGLEVQWERRLDLDLPFPQQIDILLIEDQLHILWAGGGDLHMLEMSASGQGGFSIRAADAPFNLVMFAPVVDEDGNIKVFGSGDEDDPGMYALNNGVWILIDRLGISPRAGYDRSGGLHAIWLHDDRSAGDNGIYYAGFPGGIPFGNVQVRIAELSLNPADGMDGPAFGMEDGRGYVFWTQLYRTGLRAGTMEAHSLVFSLGDPAGTTQDSPLMVPSEYHLEYASFQEGSYRAGFRYSWLPEALYGTVDITDMNALSGEADELVLAVRARVNYLRRKQEWQVGMLYLDGGQATSYQLLSFTPGNSSSPVVSADSLGYLHAAWLEFEGDSGGQLYFTSTAPAFQETLSELGWADYKNAIGSTLFGMLSGVVMLPIGLIWLVLPMVVMAVTGRMRDDSLDLTSWGERISLALIVAAYWLSRQAFFPAMWHTVPFQAWWPMMPDVLGEILRITLPFLVTILSLWIAWRNTYERGRRSFIFFSMLYLALDAIIILAVYGETVIAIF